MHSDKPIGFFDSGIGGLTVLKTAQLLMPHENYVYYADLNNVPYGTKSGEEVGRLVLKAAEELYDMGIKALVIACNTATSIAVHALREKMDIPVIGMEPAVKPALINNDNGKRVLVMATPLTLHESKFQNLVSRVDTEQIVDMLPMPGLVELAEKLSFDGNEVRCYLEKELSVFDMKNYSALVLGCTHFLFFRQAIMQILPEGIHIVDGNLGTVKHLKNILSSLCLLSEPTHISSPGQRLDFIISGKRADKEAAARFNILLDGYVL